MTDRTAHNRQIRFGPFALDRESGELCNQIESTRLILQPQPGKLLIYLAERSGVVISRQELQDVLWSGETHVDYEHGLNFCIRQIRRALGDQAHEPTYIETLPRRGYRFIATIEPASEPRPSVPTAPSSENRRRPALWLVAAACLLLSMTWVVVLSRDGWTSPADADRVSAATPPTRHQVDPEAHRVYLQGRYLAASLEGHDLQRALTSFEQAIALAPSFSSAYGALASTYTQLAYLGGLPADEGYPRARTAARRALALDDELAEAHLALALVALFHDFDWPLAENAFRRAIELEPELAAAHHGYAHFLTAMGRHDEAIREAEHARELDPSSALLSLDLGWFYYLARRYQDAVTECRHALVLEPEFASAFYCLQQAYAAEGRPYEAAAAARAALEAIGAEPKTLASLNAAMSRDGLAGLWRFNLAQLEGEGGDMSCMAFPAATYLATLGDADQALEWLEIAYQKRSGWLPFVAVEPMLDGLRDDSRFLRFVGRLKLPMG